MAHEGRRGGAGDAEAGFGGVASRLLALLKLGLSLMGLGVVARAARKLPDKGAAVRKQCLAAVGQLWLALVGLRLALEERAGAGELTLALGEAKAIAARIGRGACGAKGGSCQC